MTVKAAMLVKFLEAFGRPGIIGELQTRDGAQVGHEVFQLTGTQKTVVGRHDYGPVAAAPGIESFTKRRFFPLQWPPKSYPFAKLLLVVGPHHHLATGKSGYHPVLAARVVDAAGPAPRGLAPRPFRWFGSRNWQPGTPTAADLTARGYDLTHEVRTDPRGTNRALGSGHRPTIGARRPAGGRVLVPVDAR